MPYAPFRHIALAIALLASLGWATPPTAGDHGVDTASVERPEVDAAAPTDDSGTSKTIHFDCHHPALVNWLKVKGTLTAQGIHTLNPNEDTKAEARKVTGQYTVTINKNPIEVTSDVAHYVEGNDGRVTLDDSHIDLVEGKVSGMTLEMKPGSLLHTGSKITLQLNSLWGVQSFSLSCQFTTGDSE